MTHLQSMFTLDVRSPVKTDYSEPAFVVECLDMILKALQSDPHVRSAFYPIFAGSAFAPRPTHQQQAAFDECFDTYLINYLPQVHLVECKEYGFVCRPKPGEANIIRVNKWLGIALERAASTMQQNVQAVQMAFVVTVLHEFGHAFGLHIREGAESPLVLSVAGHEDVVAARGADGSILRNEVGSVRQVTIGEAGDLVEQRLLGSTYALSIWASARSENCWLSIGGVQVRDTNSATYDIGELQSLLSCKADG